MAQAGSAAAVAVGRVKSDVAPLLAQVQHAAAPLTERVQAVVAPVLAQVSRSVFMCDRFVYICQRFPQLFNPVERSI